MQILLTQSKTRQTKTNSTKPRSAEPARSTATKRQLGWVPQASGLTRDETRELVLEMIG